MKTIVALLAFSLLLLSSTARADGPDDQYVTIYNLIQQGDTLSEKGQSAPAMTKYAEAQTALKRFQSGYPDWNPKVVKFRLKYLAEQIAKIATVQSKPA